MNVRPQHVLLLGLAACLISLGTNRAFPIEPIPNRIVVLTFDDSVKSHFTIVRPILKRFGFGATFFITEGFDFATNKDDYMTWSQIAQLNHDGFEIGNHTRDHMPVTVDNLDRLSEQLEAINIQCLKNGIPRPVSFAYPGNAFDFGALPILEKAGIQFARRGTEPELPYDAGGGFGYEVGLDHPLLIPTAGDARPTWKLEDFVGAVKKGRSGRIAVLQFHGVPDRAHPSVHTPPNRFQKYMQYLADHHYTVLALRELRRFAAERRLPSRSEMVINDRKTMLATGRPLTNSRELISDDDLRTWLENMIVYHHFSMAEMVAATGLDQDQIKAAVDRFRIDPSDRPARQSNDPLTVLPYPGGRHPRIGFRDGEIRPQRETKCSVFLPWKTLDYVVLDVPEALWVDGPKGRELLYLAHTDVPTIWDKQSVVLDRTEWSRTADGQLTMQRRLPNGISFGTNVRSTPTSVELEMWITNGTDRKLTGLRLQNCVMLGHASEFAQQTNGNKQFFSPYTVCRNSAGTRWVIIGWKPSARMMCNPACPCMHSDPQFPDCGPGETQRVVGRLSFYEGTHIKDEIERIAATKWQHDR